MAATTPSKTTSSPPILSRPSPSSRNVEMANPVRRSFAGNPFAKPSIIANPRILNPNTPANSPSENPRRNSMGREKPVTFCDSDDKENGKDSNWKRIRVGSPVGSKTEKKNFMSPTISAAIKFTPSPRKKILAERNEPVRTSSSSASISDIKSVSFSPVVEEIQPKEVCFEFTTPKPPKPQVDFESMEDLGSKVECPEPVCENASVDIDSVNLDPSFKISPPAPATYSPVVSGRVIAPLDADPSAPPYDPKTNYLSPRPQFLHYRPNPRVEYYMGKDSEGKSLEESFISESFSDTEDTTESECSPKEAVSFRHVWEDVTSSAGEEVKEVEEEEETQLSEPNPITPITDTVSKEEAVVKESSKPCFLWRSKFTAFLMVLAVVLVSVLAINSPLADDFGIKDMRFLKEGDYSKMAERFDGLARDVRVWSSNSACFISEYISEFISNIRGARNVGPLQYYNLTLMEDARIDEYSELDVFGQTVGSMFDVEASEENGLQENGATEYEKAQVMSCYAYRPGIGIADSVLEDVVQVGNTEALEENALPIGATESIVESEEEAEADNSEEVPQGNIAFDNAFPVIGATECIVEFEEEAEADNSEEVPQGNIAFDNAEEKSVADQACCEPGHTRMEEETVMSSQADEAQVADHEPESIRMKEETVAIAGEHDEVPADTEINIPAETESWNSHVCSEALNLTSEGTDRTVSMVTVLGITFLVFASVGLIVYTKKIKSSTSSSVAAQPLMTKKLATIPTVPVNTEHIFQERSSSWNWIEETCPSEISSFQSLYPTKGLKASEEAVSQEKKGARKSHRRDSVASVDSSMGSPSYGSFTTYEKVPIKKGYGEEEIVTPVRRSSRIIRKQVTSP